MLCFSDNNGDNDDTNNFFWAKNIFFFSDNNDDNDDTNNFSFEPTNFVMFFRQQRR
jgi:hypothetical protein